MSIRHSLVSTGWYNKSLKVVRHQSTASRHCVTSKTNYGMPVDTIKSLVAIVDIIRHHLVVLGNKTRNG